MSDDSLGERPTEANRHLIAYGVGGDYIGARRARRAYRMIVMSALAVTFTLYFVEHYLRYDLNEVQYRMALTLEDDSQRAILRNVVLKDAAKSEIPTAKYVEALASIEEDDMVLERFAEAVKLAPDKGSLLIVYGCKLFQLGYYKEAREVFREATLKTTRNALPKYLQAAALAASSATEEDFRTAIALVGRTNDSGEAVLFPQPLWHESLPKSGDWYASLRRRLADQSCRPIYHLKNVSVNRALGQSATADPMEWDNWLLQIQKMGERLLGGAGVDPENLGTSQAICGVQIQKDAIAMRLMLCERAGTPPPVALIERQLKVQDAMDRLQRFETERDAAVAASEQRVQLPIRLALFGFLLLLAASVFLSLLSRLFRTDKNARALRQPVLGRRLLVPWATLLVLILVVLSVSNSGLTAAHLALGVAWYVLLGAIVVFSIVYPGFVLAPVNEVCSGLVAEPFYGDKLIQARACRRRAYLSLCGRFLNTTLGVYIILLCVWTVGYRIVSGLYPTDLRLIISGLESQEVELVHEIQRLLLP